MMMRSGRSMASEATGRSTSEVDQLLYGGEPRDDDALVRLAQELPRLEAAVRHENPEV